MALLLQEPDAGPHLVGFGRATSDGVFRAVLWDVVVAGDHQGRGLDRRRIVEALLQEPSLQGVERTDLMTTNRAGFYAQLGFTTVESQRLMLRRR